MKKLLIILMVVAMASFLFVGCNGTTPPIDPDEPVEPVVPATVAPVITSVPDISGGYINKDAAADGIVVNGTAPTYSEVKVYINGLTAGTGDTLANGVFQVVVAKADLIKAVKVDGAKTLYATATETGLAVSASSNVKKFTLDTVAPKISSSKAKAGTPAVVGNPASVTDAVFGVGANPIASALSGTAGVSFVGGAWLVECLDVQNKPSNVVITSPSSTQITYSIAASQVLVDAIPGVTLTFNGAFGIGDAATVTVVAPVAAVIAVPGYIDVTFDADVTSASMLAPPAGTGVWTAFAATKNLNPDVAVIGAAKARLTEDVAGTMLVGEAYSVSCYGPTDLAGNSIPDSAPESCTGVIMP